jgi:uncharacterized protein YegP (UPF0339 family)
MSAAESLRYPTADGRTVLVYRDDEGLWRWRKVAGNGRNVSNPGQGYTRRDSALRAARRENPPAPRAAEAEPTAPEPSRPEAVAPEQVYSP